MKIKSKLMFLFSSLLFSLFLITAGSSNKGTDNNRLSLEDYPSLDLAAETSGGPGSTFSKIEEKNNKRNFGHLDLENKEFGHLDLEKPNGRYGRKKNKLEKKKERQERREERKKTRQQLQQKEFDQEEEEEDYPHFVEPFPLIPPNEKAPNGSPLLKGGDGGDKIHSYGGPKYRDVFRNHFAGFEEEKRVSNTDWLERNITSIWFTLHHIQKGMKQIRRLFRLNSGMNHPKNSRRFHDSQSQISTEEPCDPDWEIDPNACFDEEGLTCNDKGACSCGQCLCNSPYYGGHCQCSDMECQSYDGMLCGGSARGQCRCGACICRPGYSGDSCECSLSTLECQKANGEICSGKGKCVCNRCHCDESYAGKYCEESIYSASTCERLKPCVLCMAYGKKYPSCEECNIKVQMVDDLESSRATCFMINLGCILKYSYISPTAEGETMTVLAKKDRSCL